MSSMSLPETMINEPEVTKAEALAEYRKQDLTEADLIEDLGDHETYEGLEVLKALGW